MVVHPREPTCSHYCSHDWADLFLIYIECNEMNWKVEVSHQIQLKQVLTEGYPVHAERLFIGKSFFIDNFGNYI